MQLADLSFPRQLGVGFLASLTLSAAMPGHIGWWPFLFVALVPLFLLVLELSPQRSGLTGFLVFLVYHLFLMYWIVIALHSYGNLPVIVAIITLVLLAAYMSLYGAAFCALLSLLAGRWWHRERSIAVLVWTAPILWVGLDYLRSVLFGGIPWMDIGYGLYRQPRLIQAADLGGHHAVSFTLVLSNALIVALIDRQKPGVRFHVRRERLALLFAACFLVFMGGYSYLRYEVMGQSVNRGLHADVTMVQANIDQWSKWSPEKKKATVERYIKLSEQAITDRDVELVAWPETALPFYLRNDPLAGDIRNFVQRNNIWLLTGGPGFDLKGKREDGRQDIAYFNTAYLIDSRAVLRGQYNKQHLVPFGEYVPLKKYLHFLSPLVESAGNFSPGQSSAPLDMGAIRLGVLICYESIFPELGRKTTFSGANLLANLTNDAWYGKSSAPYQSLAMTVFRAVENKRALIRVANTGISGFIDPVGNIHKQTELFTPAAVTSHLPLVELRTVFTASGHLFGAFCLCGAAAALLMGRKDWYWN